MAQQIDYARDVVAFLRTFMRCEGKYGEILIPPFLEDWLYRVFPLPAGDPVARNVLYSTTKKQGKTLLAAGILLYMAARTPGAECVIASSDLDQSRDRVLRAAKYAVERGPLAPYCKTTKDGIEFSNGATIKALPADWKGAAGGNYAAIVIDEAWTYIYESHGRLFDELVIPPTQNGIRWITSYAGLEGESTLLKDWWQRAEAGERVNEDPPIYHNQDASLLALIDQGERSWRMPWTQGEDGAAYMRQVQASERPNAFRRLWLNEWTSSESQFCDMRDFDACTSEEARPAGPGVPMVFAADASIKHDSTALVACTVNQDKRVQLGYARVWDPRKVGRLDPDKTIGDELRSLKSRGYLIRMVLADPWQMETTMQALKRAGIPVEELPQGPARTEADMALLQAINAHSLVTYPDPTLREHVRNAVATESVRGVRLAKEKTTARIDAAVALSMAHWGAVQHLQQEPAKLITAPNPIYPSARGASTTMSASKWLERRHDELSRPHNDSEAHRRWASRNHCPECYREWLQRSGLEA